jgi:hypothetical protein
MNDARGCVLAFAIAACVACTPAESADPPGAWAAFNGFYPGMSLEEAKAAGARNCGPAKFSAKDIRCEIPPERLALGAITAKQGHLEFFIMHEHRLSRIWLTFRGPHYNTVCKALAKAYGTPINSSDYIWRRSRTPALIRSPPTGLPNPTDSFAEFRFEPKLAEPEYDTKLLSPRGCLDE